MTTQQRTVTTTDVAPSLNADAQAAIAALDEVASLYGGGAVAAALARLRNLPEVDRLIHVLQRDDLRRWVARASSRIEGETAGGPMPPASVAACLRAAANVIAGINDRV